MSIPFRLGAAARLLSLLCTLCLPLASLAKAPPVAAITLTPWDFARQPNITALLKQAGFNHVTLYVPWTDVQAQEGSFQYDKADAQIELLKRAGLGVILLLDFGGRPYYDDSGKLTERSVVPAWYMQKHPLTVMRDFAGQPTPQLSFTDPVARRYTSRFVSDAVKHFSARHGSAILGFAIGLQEEHEIKFGQTGYTWRDYSPEARAAFSRQYKGDMPVINYNNEIGQPRPKVEPLLPPHRAFREGQVIEATCHYAGLIRAQKAAAIGYFGETFTSHDAIYATGAVENLARCLDIAVIDFNFYDGYQLTPSPYTLPMLASYLANSGYQRILVGAYGERWAKEGKAQALIPHIRQSLTRALKTPQVIGYEVGGFQASGAAEQAQTVDVSLLAQIGVQPAAATPSTAKPLRVGLLASKSNFYFWHGERSHGRNIHQDALVQAYANLSEAPGIEASVFGESLLLEQPQPLRNRFDVVVVPHQAALPPAVKQALKAYWAAGGLLVQDVRLGEFTDEGNPTNDWLHDVFGIKSIHWGQEPATFSYQGQRLTVDMGGQAYANHAVLEARPGYALGAKLLPTEARGWRARLRALRDWLLGRPTGGQEGTYGLVLRGQRSLAFGFLPQLAQGPSAPEWRKAYLQEIKALAERARQPAAAQTQAPSARPAPAGLKPQPQ